MSTYLQAGTTTILARRERPQILLTDETGSSYGRPRYLFTSAEDCGPARGENDGGLGDPCGKPGTEMGKFTTKSYTVLAQVDVD